MRKTSNHVNVIRLQSVLELVQESKCTIFLVMELANGGELFDRIKIDCGTRESTAKYFFQQLLEGVQHCHAQGVCHRDLKPENLLLQDGGEETVLKIADFGFSARFMMDQGAAAAARGGLSLLRGAGGAAGARLRRAQGRYLVAGCDSIRYAGGQPTVWPGVGHLQAFPALLQVVPPVALPRALLSAGQGPHCVHAASRPGAPHHHRRVNAAPAVLPRAHQDGGRAGGSHHGHHLGQCGERRGRSGGAGLADVHCRLGHPHRGGRGRGRGRLLPDGGGGRGRLGGLQQRCTAAAAAATAATTAAGAST
eukprot:GSChrysophyteH2.ASY1.ANO1.1371.1 assembled CDS